MRLRSQPESELLLRLEHLEFLFQHRKPWSNQVKVLEAHPFTLQCCLFDGLNSSFVSATTHGDFMESISADSSFCEFLQFRTRIRSRRDDEQHRVSAGSLICIQVLQSERSRLNVLVAERFLDEESHSRLESVRSQNLNQEAALEGR